MFALSDYSSRLPARQAKGGHKLKIGVAHSSYSGAGGIEKANRALYDAVVAKGHEVHFYSREKSSSGKVVSHAVSSWGVVNSLRALTFAMNATRQLRSGGYDVTHSHGEAIGADVITAHSCHSHGLKVMRAYGQEMTLRHRNIGVMDAIRLRIEKKNYRGRQFKKVIAISKAVKNELMDEYDVPENDIVVIPHGVRRGEERRSDEESLRKKVREEIGIQPNEFMLLFVSNEPHRKGLEFLLRSVQRLGNKRVRLVVVGKDDRDQFKGYAESIGISTLVFFAGVQEEVERYYLAADLFALPTLYEPFGLVITEALSAGLPVLVSQCAGAAQQFVQDRQNGLLIDTPSSVEEITSKLDELVQNNGLRETLARGATTTIFPSWEECAQRVLEIYQQVRSD